MTDKPEGARDRGTQTEGVEHADDAARPRARTVSAEVSRIVGWAVAYVAAAWLGHLTLIAGDVTLFWPASGVALVWLTTSRRGTLALELTLVGVLAAATTYLFDGGPIWHILNALVGVPLTLAVFLLLALTWVPGLWATRESRQLETLRQYGVLVAAVLVAGVSAAVVTTIALWPEPGLPFQHAGQHATRETVAMLTVGLTGLLIGDRLSGVPGKGIPQRIVAVVRRDLSGTDALIVVLAAAMAAAVVVAGFFWFTDSPVSFVLVMLVVGVGIRFTEVPTALYALAISAAALWLTGAGHGPMADIAEPERQAVAFGLFISALVITGLTISLSRRERDATIARLQESERAAEVMADDLSLVLAHLEEGVAVIEEGGRFIHANAAIGRLLRMPEFNGDDVEPVDAYHLVHTDGRPLLESEVPHVRVFAGEEDVRDILHLARPGAPGERIFEVSARLLPQLRSTDKPRAVSTIRDVTAAHQQRDALATFAQTVAHDLRSPLTSAELWARELLETYEEGPVDSETGTMMVRHIVSAAGRMQNFISDLLTYALARDQAVSPTRLEELTDVVEAVMETIAAVEGEQPEVSFAGLPGVWCDPVLVPQLFDNLIGNSRKYVAEGVVPRVRIEATPVSDDWARVRVIDNGIGIASEDRIRVFETFERARATEYDGTGLGLAICRHIVERHGGTIAVTEPPSGSGTCIELTLPMSDDAFERATSPG